MAKKKSACGGAVGKGGINPAPHADNHTVRVAAEQLELIPIDDLVPYANNAKIHDKKQIAQLRASLREFGFVTPVLIDFDNNIIAGHGRVEAARAEGMTEVPCVLVSNLTEAQRKAYILADNRLSETSAWDTEALKIELEGLEALQFDTGIIGFDAESVKEIEVSGYTRAAPGQAAEDGKHFWGDDEGEENAEYDEFVDKFKPKKTTDDCYTPENIYACVKDWAVERYGLEGAEVVRPFFPGGDFEHYDYPDNCVVIDNPPFSILSNICRFYEEHGIRYFLFAPGLTLFSINSGKCNYLPTGIPIVYENGANISTSFVTNLGEYKLEISPDLYERLSAENQKNLSELTADIPNYVYPDFVVCAAINKLTKYGQPLRFSSDEMAFVRELDSQKEQKKTIFGCGFLLSEKAAAEKAAAEKAAAEKAAATRWELSEREMELIKSLK